MHLFGGLGVSLSPAGPELVKDEYLSDIICGSISLTREPAEETWRFHSKVHSFLPFDWSTSTWWWTWKMTESEKWQKILWTSYNYIKHINLFYKILLGITMPRQMIFLCNNFVFKPRIFTEVKLDTVTGPVVLKIFNLFNEKWKVWIEWTVKQTDGTHLKPCNILQTFNVFFSEHLS